MPYFELIDLIKNIATIVVTILAAIMTGYVFLKSVRSGMLTRARIGGLIEPSAKDKEQAKALIESIGLPEKDRVPFETEQLAQYYAQVLAQSRTSFWFSLVFASLGFMVILIGVFLYSGSNVGATVVQFLAGIVMDAVASLFFVQSRNAQKSMGEFFDKLRRDRMQLESRAMCDSVHNPDAKDALKIQLALYYAGLEHSDQIAKQIIDGTWGNRAASP